MTDLTRERLAELIATIRHGVGEAMVMADIANYAGDGPPFSAGYDDVHDACNAIWAASHAIDLLDKETAPASGGVSGEDGELTKRAVGLAHSLGGDDEDTIMALLAERDGLKTSLTAIREAIEVKGGNEHMPTYDAYMAACTALHKEHETLSASNAALADALGLLREIGRGAVGNLLPVTASSRDWLAARDDFLAKHGKTEEVAGGDQRLDAVMASLAKTRAELAAAANIPAKDTDRRVRRIVRDAEGRITGFEDA